MTTTPADARTALADAEREQREAEALADALAEKARDGDPDVTPGQLGEAKQLAEFADLRIEAARRKLADAEAADRDARARHAAAEARDIATDDDPRELAPLVQAVADAVAALTEAIAARNARISVAYKALRSVAAELDDMDGRKGLLRALYGVEYASTPAATIIAHDPKVRVESLRTAELIATGVAIGAGHGHYAELREVFGNIEFMVGRANKLVPSLESVASPAA